MPANARHYLRDESEVVPRNNVCEINKVKVVWTICDISITMLRPIIIVKKKGDERRFIINNNTLHT